MPGNKDQDVGIPSARFSLTPGFRVETSQVGDTAFSTQLSRLDSLEQREFAARFPQILSGIDALKGSIAPGASALRSARLAEVESGRSRAVSNLRDNLARRRVAGSSFASDALARTEREFSQAAASESAKSFLEEFSLNSKVLAQESATIFAGIERELKELGVVSNLTQDFSRLALQAELADANLAAQSAQGAGQLAGSIIGLAATPFLGPIGAAAGGQVASSLFGGGGASPASAFPSFSAGGALGLA